MTFARSSRFWSSTFTTTGWSAERSGVWFRKAPTQTSPRSLLRWCGCSIARGRRGKMERCNVPGPELRRRSELSGIARMSLAKTVRLPNSSHHNSSARSVVRWDKPSRRHTTSMSVERSLRGGPGRSGAGWGEFDGVLSWRGAALQGDVDDFVHPRNGHHGELFEDVARDFL